MNDLELRTFDNGSEKGFQHRVKTEPASEPITTAEIKNYLKVNFTNDDTLLDEMVTAARKQAETYTQRAFISQVIELFWDRFQLEMALPFPPNISIDSVKTKFEDQTDTLVLDTDYFVLGLDTKKVRIPVVSSRKSLEIEMTAGYGAAASDVPKDIKLAIMKIAGNYYDNRIDWVTGTIIGKFPENSRSLLDQYIVYNF